MRLGSSLVSFLLAVLPASGPGRQTPAAGPSSAATRVEFLLATDRPEQAEAAVAKALKDHPDDAILEALAGDVYFRQARFEDAERAYRRALRSMPEMAHAHAGLGRVLLTECDRKGAREEFRKACELRPSDATAVLYCAAVQTNVARKVELLEEVLGLGAAAPPGALDRVRSEIEILDRLGGRETFVLQNPPVSATLKLHRILSRRLLTRGFAVKAKFDRGKPVTLLVDTGASGILLDRKAATRSGVESLGRVGVRGLGDQGARAAKLGWARSLRVGKLVFQDCTVTYTEQPVSDDFDGIVGANVFSRYLIQFDFPKARLKLLPLPPQKTGAGGSDRARRNVPDALRGYTPVREVNDKVLIPTTVNGVRRGYFAIDTGSELNIISARFAAGLTKVQPERWDSVAGISGSVLRVYDANHVTLQFSHFEQNNAGMRAIDLSGLSRSLGAEVSGLLGMQVLQHLTVTIDYRDGLVDFAYH